MRKMVLNTNIVICVYFLISMNLVQTAPADPSTTLFDKFEKEHVEAPDVKCLFPSPLLTDPNKIELCDKNASAGLKAVCGGILNLTDKVCSKSNLTFTTDEFMNVYNVISRKHVTDLCSSSPGIQLILKSDKCQEVCIDNIAGYHCKLYETMLEVLYSKSKGLTNLTQIHLLIHDLQEYFPFPPLPVLQRGGFLSPCEHESSDVDLTLLCMEIKNLAVAHGNRSIPSVNILDMYNNVTSTDWDPCSMITKHPMTFLTLQNCSRICNDESKKEERGKICRSIAFGLAKLNEIELLRKVALSNPVALNTVTKPAGDKPSDETKPERFGEKPVDVTKPEGSSAKPLVETMPEGSGEKPLNVTKPVSYEKPEDPTKPKQSGEKSSDVTKPEGSGEKPLEPVDPSKLEGSGEKLVNLTKPVGSSEKPSDPISESFDVKPIDPTKLEGFGEKPLVVTNPEGSGEKPSLVTNPEGSGEKPSVVTNPEGSGEKPLNVTKPEGYGEKTLDATNPEGSSEKPSVVTNPEGSGEKPSLVTNPEGSGEKPSVVTNPEGSGEKPSLVTNPEGSGEKPSLVTNPEGSGEKASVVTNPEGSGEKPSVVTNSEGSGEKPSVVTNPEGSVEKPLNVTTPEGSVEKPGDLTKPEEPVEQPLDGSKPKGSGEKPINVTKSGEKPESSNLLPDLAKTTTGYYSDISEEDSEEIDDNYPDEESQIGFDKPKGIVSSKDNKAPSESQILNEEQHYAAGKDEAEPTGISFMSYFLVFLVLCVAGYIVFHNKQKIIALVIEGKSSHNGRRPNSKEYRRLKTDDVMPSLEKSASSTNYVY